MVAGSSGVPGAVARPYFGSGGEAEAALARALTGEEPSRTYFKAFVAGVQSKTGGPDAWKGGPGKWALYTTGAIVVGTIFTWVMEKSAKRIVPHLEKAASNKVTRGIKEGVYTGFEKAQDGYYWTKGKLKKLLGFKNPAQKAAAQAAKETRMKEAMAAYEAHRAEKLAKKAAQAAQKAEANTIATA